MEIPKLKSKDVILGTVGIITAISLIHALTGDLKNHELRTIRACVKDIPDNVPCQDTDQPLEGLPIDVWENGSEQSTIIYTDGNGTVQIPRNTVAWGLTRPPEDYPFDWYDVVEPNNKFRNDETDYLFTLPTQPRP